MHHRLYLGSYTDAVGHCPAAHGSGVVCAAVQPNGLLDATGAFDGAGSNPSALCSSPDGSVLYVASEVAPGTPGAAGGSVSALSVDAATGALSPLNALPSGLATCHLAVSGDYLLAAEYFGGTVRLYALDPTDGSLVREAACVAIPGRGARVDKERQEAVHPHQAVLAPSDATTVYVPDLGSDKVCWLTLEDGELEYGGVAFRTARGAGPRHMAFHPWQPWAFVTNELDSTVVALRVEARGKLKAVAPPVSTLPAKYAGPGNNTGAIAVHPSGHRVYVTNRGAETVATFAVDEATGALTPLGHVSSGGAHPRDLKLSPSGDTLYVVNQNSDVVCTFKVDADGNLPATPVATFACASPTWLEILPGVAEAPAGAAADTTPLVSRLANIVVRMGAVCVAYVVYYSICKLFVDMVPWDSGQEELRMEPDAYDAAGDLSGGAEL